SADIAPHGLVARLVAGTMAPAHACRCAGIGCPMSSPWQASRYPPSSRYGSDHVHHGNAYGQRQRPQATSHGQATPALALVASHGQAYPCGHGITPHGLRVVSWAQLVRCLTADSCTFGTIAPPLGFSVFHGLDPLLQCENTQRSAHLTVPVYGADRPHSILRPTSPDARRWIAGAGRPTFSRVGRSFHALQGFDCPAPCRVQ